MSMNNAALELALRAAMSRLTLAVANRDAPNSLKLEGLTLAQVTATILAGTASNATLFDGKTYAEVITAATSGNAADIDALEAAFATFIARTDNPNSVTKAQVGLGAVENYGIASQADADAKAADKYVTPSIADYMVQKAVDALVGAAPETLNTISEIAAALGDDPDIINTLLTAIGTKETPAGAQAKADAAVTAAAADATTKADAAQAAAIAAAALDATSKADAAQAAAIASGESYTDTAIAGVGASLERATQAEAEGGTDNVKLMTPLSSAQAIAALGATLFLGVGATAVDSALLEGQTLAQVIATAQAGVDMSNVVQKTDDFAAYSVGEEIIGDLVTSLRAADTANVDAITVVSDALGAFIASKATEAEAIAGTDDVKYITALALKAKVDAAINSVVDGAPEALDTLKELAIALADQDNEVAAIVTVLDTKQNAAQVSAAIAAVTDLLAARVDALEAEDVVVDGRLDALEAAVGSGSNFMQTGVTDLGTNPVALASDVPEAAPRSLKAIVDALEAADVVVNDRITGEVAGVNSAITAVSDAAAAANTLVADRATALEAADVVSDGRLDVLETGIATKLEQNGSLDAATVNQDVEGTPTQVLIGTVLSALEAHITAVENGGAGDLATLQSAFNDFVAAKATGAEVIAGTDDVKYTTSLAVKAAIVDAIDALVGAAPAALDTINEIAAALNNDPNVINNLMTAIGTKLDATATAVDSAKLGGVVAADYATKVYVDDTVEALTEGFIASAVDLAPNYKGDLTIANLGSGSYGFNASGSIAPATYGSITVQAFHWNASVLTVKVLGDKTAAGIDAAIVNSLVLNAPVSATFASGSTTFVFTVDKVLPTTGVVPVAF
jgi:hypothetical protein